MIPVSRLQKDLGLTCLVETQKAELDIRSPDLNRPGMQFCGFYEHFAWERPQIIGIVEMAYLEQQEPQERIRVLKEYFSYQMPCIIICRNLTPPPELLALARAADVPVFITEMHTSRFLAITINYLARQLAPHETRCPGGCLWRWRAAEREKWRRQKRGGPGAGEERTHAGGG